MIACARVRALGCVSVCVCVCACVVVRALVCLFECMCVCLYLCIRGCCVAAVCCVIVLCVIARMWFRVGVYVWLNACVCACFLLVCMYVLYGCLLCV